MPEVTVIIPVYNVAKYLDQCLESVVNQTLFDIEIILINDGSTDISSEKCMEWARRDSRIIYVSKRNEGQGPSRNLGIRMASGKYVAFIDSDDWYDGIYVERMYLEAEKSGADITVCGYHGYNDEYGRVTCTFYPDFTSAEGAFLASYVSVWTKLFKKDFFFEHKIEMPGFPGQDAAINGFAMTKAHKIALVQQPLYFYRDNRVGSTMYDYMKHTENTVRFLSYHCELFKRDNTFERYKNWLLIYSLAHIRLWKNKLQSKGCEPDFWFKNVKEFLNGYFPGWDKLYSMNISCIGSYSLYFTVYRYSPVDFEKLSNFCFSSIISIMSPKTARQIPENGNSFRMRAMSNDFNKSYVADHNISGHGGFTIIDFLDERFDIAQFDDEYYTISEAFAESGINSDYKILNRWDTHTILLWQEKCLEFIGLLKQRFSPSRVIIVKNRLAEYYGEFGKEHLFHDFEAIRFINSKLDECYAFFECNFPGVFVLNPADMNDCYTFKYFRHGCHPWHYNNEYYIRIANEVTNYLKEKL